MAKQSQKNAADVAAKWANNLGAAGPAIQKGVQAVQTAPTQLAAKNADGYLAGIQRAVASGKWQANLNKVSLQQWQSAMINKGLPRIQSGAQIGKTNMQTFMTNFLPYVYNAQQQLSSQPRGNLEQNIARMTTFIRAIANYQNPA
jgi:hypothetical protein